MTMLLKSFLYLFGLTSAAHSQWVPIAGRIVTHTESLAPDGSVESKWTTTTQYVRSSSGSFLVQNMGRSGKPVSGTLMDFGKSQRIYSLTYQTGKVKDLHQAVNHNIVNNPPHGLTQKQMSVSLGTAKVGGVDCIIVPVYDLGPNLTRVLVGKAWIAPAYNNLVMHEDVIRTSPYGSKKHVVREFTIVSLNEPDPSLFSTDRADVASHWKVAPAGR